VSYRKDGSGASAAASSAYQAARPLAPCGHHRRTGVTMMINVRRPLCSVLVAVTAVEAQPPRRAPVYDRVILGGRVIDSESRLDAVRNVGIVGDRIAVVTTAPIRGRDSIDARGLVVAPGFIDLHAHGQDEESYRYYAMDGVTTALEMEIGVWPVAQFYANREGKAPVNFGGTIAHFGARRWALDEEVDDGSERLTDTRTRWAKAETTPGILDSVRTYLVRGLDEGALGVGMGIAYTPGATALEIYHNFELCAERKVVCFVHMRGGIAGLQEVIANALGTGAGLHIVHINSTGGPNVRLMLDLIRRARARGLDVTTEFYPYTASSTFLQSALFDSAEVRAARGEYRFDNIIWAATGEHLTAETFRKYRAQGGTVIVLGMPDSAVTIPLADSTVIVASDAVPYVNHRGHPRLAGTFARVLGRYSREQRLVSLPEAVRRMTYLPAKRMEVSVPQFRTKGRLRPGADADVTVFDPSRVIDRATYEEPAQYSAGIVHVLVNGTPVVRNEKLIEGVFPGRPIRRVTSTARSAAR
jgi:N-acyl-D-aspartate/D-glutamate deacylase